MSSVMDLCRLSKAAALELRGVDSARKNAALVAIAEELELARAAIFAANARDLENARSEGLSAPMLDRLTLTPERFATMVKGVRDVVALPDPVGEVLLSRTLPSGLRVEKVREPLGVVAVVFESRPNVFVDTAALCLKTSNAVILRGGHEALESNLALEAAVRSALVKCALPENSVQLVHTTAHADVTELVRAVGFVDVAIPRGGERLIRAMCEAALVPVLKHYKGVCHLYLDKGYNHLKALEIIENAKLQRPSACNALECLLINRAEAETFLPKLRKWALAKGVMLYETNQDWGREFLANEMNVGVVDDVKAAIEHINAFGSHHSDAILTQDKVAAERFQLLVDSAAVYVNASTRFTDGGEFGLGAEIGISTDKLHARGPMGLEELCSYKWLATGDNLIRR